MTHAEVTGALTKCQSGTRPKHTDSDHELPNHNIRLPNKTDVKVTVRLSSSSVLIGRDSTTADAMETTRKLKTSPQLSWMNPNKKK
ncbi:hypothetical protein H6P81_006461 [Aristolochia fimbriata]|uniref:Uncharacterized protein n=1 Tax=Aristolochia fimbriata TaxID=158543 RepID=A0AAV7F194_ARIFI|nr:hypothetical protein H6P81_006461 [Aristolochia fimbriata]